MPPDAPGRGARLALSVFLLALVALAFALPHGRMAPNGHMVAHPESGEREWVHDEAKLRTHAFANAAGTIAFLLTIGALALPQLRRPRASRWHARLGMGVLALAAVHTLVYVVEGSFRGWMPGALSIFAFAVHGLTGALKAPLARAWGPAWWRLAHPGAHGPRCF